MATSIQLSCTINGILEELSMEECKRMSYLCGSFDNDRCALNLREKLQTLLIRINQADLTELVFRMKRYDLLKRKLGISKTEAERLLQTNNTLSEYRILMADLSDDIGREDLGSLIFLLGGTLPKEKVEKFECFLDIVVELEKLDQISSTKMDMMEKCLKAIHRADLVKRLRQFQSQCRAEPVKPSAVMHSEAWEFGRISASTSLYGCPSGSCSSARPLTSKPSVNPVVYPIPSSSRSSFHQQRKEEVYRMQTSPRGICLIIDCVGIEGAQLEKTFTSLNFTVSLHQLLGVQDMYSTLQEISREDLHHKTDAFVCCIISRSRSGSHMLGTDSNGRGLNLEAIRNMFAPTFCPGLTGKPKLFFIQGYEEAEQYPFETAEQNRFEGYRSFQDGDLETDSPATNISRRVEVAEQADVFWSHCWTSERQLEKQNHHSVYLQSLRDALVDGQKRSVHLVDLHMAVNQAVFSHNQRHPDSEYKINLSHTLRKNVYLSSTLQL